MTGLILKDLLILRKTIKTYILFLAGYAALAWAGLFPPSVVATVMQIIVMMLPMSAFAYDEATRWDRYAATFPAGRRAVVGARYVFALILAVGASVLGLLAAALLSIVKGQGGPLFLEILSGMFTALGLGLFICDLLLPLCYKLGVERARPFMYIIVFVPTIAILLLAQSDLIDLSALNALDESALLLGFAAFPLLMLLGMAPSYLISCRIMDRKEL